MLFTLVVKDGLTIVAEVTIPVRVNWESHREGMFTHALAVERGIEMLTGYRCHVTLDTRTPEQLQRRKLPVKVSSSTPAVIPEMPVDPDVQLDRHGDPIPNPKK